MFAFVLIVMYCFVCVKVRKHQHPPALEMLSRACCPWPILHLPHPLPHLPLLCLSLEGVRRWGS